MNYDTKWIKTDKHVYGALWREHHAELGVYSSFSNPEPSELSSQPQMETTWSFKNSNVPLMRSRTEWEDGKRKETEMIHFWLASNIVRDE